MMNEEAGGEGSLRLGTAALWFMRKEWGNPGISGYIRVYPAIENNGEGLGRRRVFGCLALAGRLRSLT